MNIVLWILAGVLAFMFFMAGLMKLIKTRSQALEERGEQMGWVEDFTDTQFRLIGAVEVLGALGVILPLATGILPILTPLAALGLAADQVVAARVHARRGNEEQMVKMNYFFAAIALVVAIGRFAGL